MSPMTLLDREKIKTVGTVRQAASHVQLKGNWRQRVASSVNLHV